MKVLHGKFLPLQASGATLRIDGMTKSTTIGQLKSKIIELNRSLERGMNVQWFAASSTLMWSGIVLEKDNMTLSDYGIVPSGSHRIPCVAHAHWYSLNVPLTKYKLKLFQQTFNDFDEDGSGEIDADELYTLMQKLGLNRTRTQCREMVESVDEDLSGEIGFEEFCMLMVKVMQEDCESAIMAAMEDGKDVTEEELRERDSGALIMWDPTKSPLRLQSDNTDTNSTSHNLDWKEKKVVYDSNTNSYIFE